MELMEAINARRSVRAYKPDAVEREKIERLLDAAIKAPNGMNDQPWAFGIIQDAGRLRGYNEQVKSFLLSKVGEWPWLERFKEHLEDPDYSVFYNAPALVTIYGKNQSPMAQIDCTLAAENLMLAAADMGLGTCWIGFAAELMNSPEVKAELGAPEEYLAVAPIIVGYPDGDTPPRERNAPEIAYWR